MKSFQSRLGVLVIVSIFMIFPIFCMDFFCLDTVHGVKERYFVYDPSVVSNFDSDMAYKFPFLCSEGCDYLAADELEDCDIKRSIGRLFDYAEDDTFCLIDKQRLVEIEIACLRQLFPDGLYKLKKCAKEVLIERGLCKERGGNLECVGDLETALGPMVQVPDLGHKVDYRKLWILELIMPKEKIREVRSQKFNIPQQELCETRLNSIFDGEKGVNIKRAKDN